MNSNKHQKKDFFTVVLFSIFILFFLAIFALDASAQRRLEIIYPEIMDVQLETVEIGIPQYAVYIFYFFIATVGLIAFGVLLYAGFRYLTSTGKPEEIKKARQQIKSAILGIILLFFSYLILITVNPQLTIFNIPPLTPIGEPDITEPSVPPPLIEDPLARIRVLAQASKDTAGLIMAVSQEIQSLTDRCNCSRTQPLCSVVENYYGPCQFEYCYSAAPDQPCPDYQQIELKQQKLVDLRDLIVYYKNRSRAEAADLKDEAEKIITQEIEWLEYRIETERRTLSECETDICRRLQEEIIDSLEKGKEKIEMEKDYKLALSAKLIELADAIERLKEPTTELAALPDRCLTDVKEKCQGSCAGGGHDTPGCFPSGCSGGNPCPTEDIQEQLDNINSIVLEIKQIAEEIIRIVDSIPGLPESPPPPVPISCEAGGGICLEPGQEPPPNYDPYAQIPCPDDKQCYLPEQQITCNCSTAPYEGCANLTDYGIPIKPGAGTMTDPRLAEKLVVFNSCLLRNNITGWRITEACPPQIQHQSILCHHIAGTCVDANSTVLCRNQPATISCIREAGFSNYLNECHKARPHFHLIF